ncbi:phage tail protein [Burkholderia multivorans]|nr:caudovirales tail fiber assembly protein [Burkholderia multivorans CF2]MBR8086683.1 phage tail protein [Burkholderia vietnamiensis]MBU9409977.1 phage tail assembly chaperone [Burkholderia multivorans]MBU9469648.1 phage tail assembly chaperone [Burkholderia multivorans]MCO8625134.1 phage tail protein [Burkholderia multivorans]
MMMARIYAGYDAQRRIQSFFDDESRPDGLSFVEITPEQHRMLIAGMAAGKTMAVDDTGQPILIDPPKQTRDQLAAAKRVARDAALRATDWLVARHQDEKLIGNGTTLTSGEFETLVKYRQALRDISSADRWPDVDLPAAPEFLTSIR